MPRKPLIVSSEFPYHVTNRSNNKDFFYLPLDSLWLVFEEVFEKLESLYGLEIHAFVLMTNHYHLIARTPHSNLSDAMTYLHREVSRKSNKISRRVNHFFGGRYKWCLIESDHYYQNSVRYVFQNPLRAKVSNSVLDYRYSSIWRILHSDSRWIERKPLFLESDLTTLTDWLDKRIDEVDQESISRALRRRVFKLPTNDSGWGVRKLSGDTL